MGTVFENSPPPECFRSRAISLPSFVDLHRFCWFDHVFPWFLCFHITWVDFIVYFNDMDSVRGVLFLKIDQLLYAISRRDLLCVASAAYVKNRLVAYLKHKHCLERPWHVAAWTQRTHAQWNQAGVCVCPMIIVSLIHRKSEEISL